MENIWEENGKMSWKVGLCRYMRLVDWSVGFRFVGIRSVGYWLCGV